MKNIYSALLLLVFWFGNAQNPTDRDPSFNQFTLPLNNYYVDGQVTKIVLQPDNKAIILEKFNYQTRLVRLNGNLLDNQSLIIHQNSERMIDFVLQSDGKILALIEIDYDSKIVRYNNDFTLDVNFTPVMMIGRPEKILLQDNNKILVFNRNPITINTIEIQTKIFRLNADGSLDNSFAPAISAAMEVPVVQSDGKIVGSIRDNNIYKAVRLNEDGSTDSSFILSTGTGNSYEITKIVIQDDNKILVLGFFNQYNNTYTSKIIRLNPNGTVDSSFATSGYSFMNYDVSSDTYLKDIMVLPNGKYWVIGRFDKYNNEVCSNIVRLNADGSKDASLNNNGLGLEFNSYFPSNVILNLALQTDGQMIIAGDFYKYDENSQHNIVKVNPDGTTDNSFNNICKGFDRQVHLIKELANGKILAIGFFSKYNGQNVNNIAILNNDGSIDNTFNAGTGFNLDQHQDFNTLNAQIIYNAHEQADGKLVLTGTCGHTYNGIPFSGILRLNPNGTIDTTFDYGTGFNGSTSTHCSSVLQSDGKIVIGGDTINSYNNVSFVNLIRLMPNGDIDPSFNTGTSQWPYSVRKLHLHTDGKIIVQYGSQLQRINPTGLFDSSFEFSESDVLCMQPDGKIMVKTSTGVTQRLNQDGSVDNSFTPLPFAFNPDLKIATVQLDGKTLIKDTARIHRFHSNGALDLSYNMPIGFTSLNYYSGFGDIVSLSDGKILMAGAFNFYNNLEERGLVRLLGEDYYFIQGENRLDSNANGCDAADLIFPNIKYNIVSSTSNNTLIANATGNYSIGLIPGSYTITPTFENPNYFTINPSSITANFPSQTSPLAQNFCITPNGVHSDLEVSLVPVTPARPGFDAKYRLVYKNKGNQAQSGTVNLTFNDATLDVVSSVPTVSNQTPNILSWNFTALNPYETREVTLTLNLNSPTENPALNSGGVLNYTTTIASAQTEETPDDNTFILNQTLVNSYDPNDKICLQGTTIGPDKVGDYVHYVIRFENTGTYTAQNITVSDFIDPNVFDINTLVPVNGSHLFTTKITQGNKVEFVFENINLPFNDSNNDGYVVFKIKTKPTLVLGDTFSNGASIYFDYNSAITTNTYTTTIQTLSTQDFSFVNYFTLYPNPANDILNISKKGEIAVQSIQIYNTLGQLILVITNARDVTTIDVANLQSGSYFVKINSDKGTSNTRFIKK